MIGLPGDRIQMRDGLLYINEEPVKRERTRYPDLESVRRSQQRKAEQASREQSAAA